MALNGKHFALNDLDCRYNKVLKKAVSNVDFAIYFSEEERTTVTMTVPKHYNYVSCLKTMEATIVYVVDATANSFPGAVR